MATLNWRSPKQDVNEAILGGGIVLSLSREQRSGNETIFSVSVAQSANPIWVPTQATPEATWAKAREMAVAKAHEILSAALLTCSEQFPAGEQPA